jgi:hypothetical protein
MHNALWNPVLSVADIAPEREVSLGLNSYVFKFDCLFVHEATLNGSSALPRGLTVGQFRHDSIWQNLAARIRNAGKLNAEPFGKFLMLTVNCC